MDNDMSGGVTGAVYDYGFRVYDSRIAKFLSVDPLTKSYPWFTPYQFAGNMPIAAIDLDGAEVFMSIHGGRWTIPILKNAVGFTLAVNAGIIGDWNGNVGLYVDPHFGISVGTENGFNFLGIGVNFETSEMKDLKGWSSSFGGSTDIVKFLNGEWDIAWPTVDNKGRYPNLPDQFKLFDPTGQPLTGGGSYSFNGTGKGSGIHGDLGYTFMKQYGNIPELVNDVYEKVNSILRMAKNLPDFNKNIVLDLTGKSNSSAKRLEDYIPKSDAIKFFDGLYEQARQTTSLLYYGCTLLPTVTISGKKQDSTSNMGQGLNAN